MAGRLQQGGVGRRAVQLRSGGRRRRWAGCRGWRGWRAAGQPGVRRRAPGRRGSCPPAQARTQLLRLLQGPWRPRGRVGRWRAGSQQQQQQQHLHHEVSCSCCCHCGMAALTQGRPPRADPLSPLPRAHTHSPAHAPPLPPAAPSRYELWMAGKRLPGPLPHPLARWRAAAGRQLLGRTQTGREDPVPPRRRTPARARTRWRVVRQHCAPSWHSGRAGRGLLQLLVRLQGLLRSVQNCVRR